MLKKKKDCSKNSTEKPFTLMNVCDAIKISKDIITVKQIPCHNAD